MAFSIRGVFVDVQSEFASKGASIIRAVVVPVLVLVGLYVVMYSRASTPISMMANIASLIVYALIAVNCHRLILVGPGTIPGSWGLHVSGYVLRYILWMIGLAIILSLTALPFLFIFIPFVLVASESSSGQASWLPMLMGLVVGVTISYFSARLSPILPARAVGDSTGLSRIWDLSNGRSIKVWITLTVPMIAFSGISALGYMLIGERPSLVEHMVVEFLYSPFIIIQVAILSCTYRALVSNPPTDWENEDEDELAGEFS